MKIWSWDEVACEVATDDVEIADNQPAHLIKAAWEHKVEAMEASEYAMWTYTDFPTFQLITGRFGRDRQYMLWWGDEGDCQKFADLLR